MKNINCTHFTDSIYYDFEQTARLMRKAGNQFFEMLKIELTVDEYAALDTISCNAGICQRDLAKLILKDRANTGRILDNLEGRGLITRFIDTKNNRLVKKTGVTGNGYKKLKEINNKIDSHFRETTEDFSEEEIVTLQQSIRKFRENLEKRVNMNI